MNRIIIIRTILNFIIQRQKTYFCFYVLLSLCFGLLDAYFLIKVNSISFLQASYSPSDTHDLVILLFITLLFFLRIPNLYLCLLLAKTISLSLNKYLFECFLIYPKQSISSHGSKQLSYLLSVESDLFYEGIVYPLLVLVQVSTGLFILMFISAFVAPTTIVSLLLIGSFLSFLVLKYVRPFLASVSVSASFHRNIFSLKSNQFFENLDILRSLGIGPDYVYSLQKDENIYKFNSGLGFLTGLAPKVIIESSAFFVLILGTLLLPLFPNILFDYQSQILSSAFLLQRMISSSLLIGVSLLSLSVNKKRTLSYIKLLYLSFKTSLSTPKVSGLSIPSDWNCIKLKDCSIRMNSSRINIGSFSIKRGEFVGITGPSGSGKSLFIKLLAGIDPSSSGTLYVDNSVYDFSSLIAISSLSLQKPFFIYDTLLQNLCSCRNLDSVDYDHLEKIITTCGLNQISDQYGFNNSLGEFCSYLSGGQQLRLSVGRALYIKSSLLILDEPTSGLDIDSSRRLISNIRQFFPSISLVLVSHSPDDLELCDRVYIKNSVASPLTLK
jgi:putative ABC transport system ATP-binding protein